MSGERIDLASGNSIRSARDLWCCLPASWQWEIASTLAGASASMREVYGFKARAERAEQEAERLRKRVVELELANPANPAADLHRHLDQMTPDQRQKLREMLRAEVRGEKDAGPDGCEALQEEMRRMANRVHVQGESIANIGSGMAALARDGAALRDASAAHESVLSSQQTQLRDLSVHVARLADRMEAADMSLRSDINDHAERIDSLECKIDGPAGNGTVPELMHRLTLAETALRAVWQNIVTTYNPNACRAAFPPSLRTESEPCERPSRDEDLRKCGRCTPDGWRLYNVNPVPGNTGMVSSQIGRPDVRAGEPIVDVLASAPDLLERLVADANEGAKAQGARAPLRERTPVPAGPADFPGPNWRIVNPDWPDGDGPYIEPADSEDDGA